jgi:hypothetical protein
MIEDRGNHSRYRACGSVEHCLSQAGQYAFDLVSLTALGRVSFYSVPGRRAVRTHDANRLAGCYGASHVTGHRVRRACKHQLQR